MNAIIHFQRIGKAEALYVETLVRDDGTRLDTRTELPAEFAKAWSKEAWQQYGILADGRDVRVVCKHHFYQEWFDVIELFDEQGVLLGTYCDVLTPLEKRDGEYYLLDLLLDLFIFPDGRWIELDWDEFETAARQGKISAEHQAQAVKTLRRMVDETKQGSFPAKYITGL